MTSTISTAIYTYSTFGGRTKKLIRKILPINRISMNEALSYLTPNVYLYFYIISQKKTKSLGLIMAEKKQSSNDWN